MAAARAHGGRRLAYLPGLDGLRGLAVLAVLIYHAEPRWLPGGYLGVEVFFVLSGYLITGLLLAEWQQSGRVSVTGFWLRRARRLLPALFTLMGVTLAAACLLLPGEVARLRADAAAAAVYVTNWYLIFSHQPYFQAMGRPSLLRHLWSLAVEEQFYLVWPLLFTAGMRLGRRRGMLLTAFAGAAAALMAALYRPDADPSRLYYGTDTRAAGLLLGATLALAWPVGSPKMGEEPSPQSAPSTPGPPSIVSRAGSRARGGGGASGAAPTDRPRPSAAGGGLVKRGIRPAPERDMPPGEGLPLSRADRGPIQSSAGEELGWGLDLAGLLALGVLGWLCLRLDEYQPALYQGGLAAVDLATAVAIAAVAYPGSSLGAGPLGSRALGWVGTRSYSIYLWHWPVYMLTRPQLDLPLAPLPIFALRLAVTGALAELSYRWVEAPIRGGALGRAWTALRAASGARRRRLALRWAGAFVALLACSVTLAMTVAAARPAEAPAYLALEEVHIVAARDAPGAVRVDGGAVSLAPGTPTPTARPGGAAATPVPTGAAAPGSIPFWAHHLPISCLSPTPPAPRWLGSDWRRSRFRRVPTRTPLPTPPPTVAPTPALTYTAQPGAHISAVGDSVMLGAVWYLQQALGPIDIDAVVSRQVPAAIELLRTKRDAGELGDVVVLHIGNNGGFTAAQFDLVMEALGDRRAIFLNLKEARPWEGPNNTVIAEGVARYPNAALVDWHAASVDRPEYFWDDGIHLRPEGARAYAALVAAAIAGVQLPSA